MKAGQRQVTAGRAVGHADVVLTPVRRMVVQVAHVEPHLARAVHVDRVLGGARQRGVHLRRESLARIRVETRRAWIVVDRSAERLLIHRRVVGLGRHAPVLALAVPLLRQLHDASRLRNGRAVTIVLAADEHRFDDVGRDAGAEVVVLLLAA